MGLERWLSSEEQILFLQRAGAWSSAAVLGGSQLLVAPTPGLWEHLPSCAQTHIYYRVRYHFILCQGHELYIEDLPSLRHKCLDLREKEWLCSQFQRVWSTMTGKMMEESHSCHGADSRERADPILLAFSFLFIYSSWTPAHRTVSPPSPWISSFLHCRCPQTHLKVCLTLP